MSDSTPRLPARPSLEQLRKQAKDRVHQMRQADAGATLAQAQLALAREYGFESWPKLVHHVESLSPSRLAQFERLADDVLAGYAGDNDALRRIGAHMGQSYSAEQVRVRVRDKLDAVRNAPGQPTLDDARTMVALLHDFASWEELRGGADELRYRVDDRDNMIEPREPLGVGDWDSLFAIMRERGITGLRSALIDDAGLRKLAAQEFVTHIDLNGNQRFTDDGLLALAAMPQLEDLDLSGWYSRVTDRGMEVLRHLRRLKRLHMCWPQKISDAGAAYLSSCDDLERVNLMGTPTGDGTVNALRGKRRLRRFASGKTVTDAGLPLLHDFPAFKVWDSDAPPIENDGPNALMLDGGFSDAGLAGLRGLAGLYELDLFWHTSALTGEGLGVLAELPHLEVLGADGRLCDDAAMRHIGAHPLLRKIRVQGTVATDDGFVALSRSQTIERIWGRECPNLTGRGFVALASMPRLNWLGVSCKQVDDAALAALPEFPALAGIMPMDVPDDGFRHVGRCERLQDLSCMYCRDTGDVATGHIGSLRHLTHYYAGKTRITDASLEILSRIESLERLEFWECAGLTDAGITALARLPNLREISVDGSPRVTRAGLKVFPPTVRTS